MHQGRNIIVIFTIAVSFSFDASAQLNRSNEVIETIQDIELQDDSATAPHTTKSDEEFQKKKLSQDEEASSEQSVQKEDLQKDQEDIGSYDEEENIVEKKDVVPEKQQVYEDELRKNMLERKDTLEPSQEDEGFLVDSSEKPNDANTTENQAQQKQPKENPGQQEQLTDDGLFEERDLQKDQVEQQERLAQPEEELTEPQEAIAPEAPEDVAHQIPTNFDGENTDSENKRLSRDTQVEIEPNPYEGLGVLKKEVRDFLKPFRERRPTWTYNVNLGTSNYEPQNYFSDIVAGHTPSGDYQELYTNKPQVPMTGASVEFKRNFHSFSLGAGLAYDYFLARGTDTTLFASVPSVRASLYLDDLFKEPYVVPYGSFGYSYFVYKENYDDGTTIEEISGKTDHFFASFGLLFQLDWLDSSAHANAYNEIGLENTFIFIEAKTLLSKGVQHKAEDPDFSSRTYFAAGLRFEF